MSALMPCQASIDRLGGTVWRSQAVVFRDLHGLPTSSVDRATHHSTLDRALVRSQRIARIGSDN